MDFTIKQIDNETSLRSVLEMCWEILGQPNTDIYSEQAWRERLSDNCLLIYAEIGDKPAAAVVGRAENTESVVLGYCCCKEEYRGKGITSALLAALEDNAAENGYKYITLGSDGSAWGFYEKCGYSLINEIHGQRIYQKIEGTVVDRICRKILLYRGFRT